MERDKKDERLGRIAVNVLFVMAIAVFFVFGMQATVRVAGLGLTVAGAHAMWYRSVAVGVEGRAPSIYLRGFSASFLGIATASFGLGLLVCPEIAVRFMVEN